MSSSRIVTLSSLDQADPELRSLVEGAIRTFGSRRTASNEEAATGRPATKSTRKKRGGAPVAAAPVPSDDHDNDEPRAPAGGGVGAALPVAPVCGYADDPTTLLPSGPGPFAITMPDGTTMIATDARQIEQMGLQLDAQPGPPLTRWDRVKRWWSRHKWDVAKIALVTGGIVLVAGVAVAAGPFGALIILAAGAVAVAAGEAMLVGIDSWMGRNRAAAEAAEAAGRPLDPPEQQQQQHVVLGGSADGGGAEALRDGDRLL